MSLIDWLWLHIYLCLVDIWVSSAWAWSCSSNNAAGKQPDRDQQAHRCTQELSDILPLAQTENKGPASRNKALRQEIAILTAKLRHERSRHLNGKWDPMEKPWRDILETSSFQKTAQALKKGTCHTESHMKGGTVTRSERSIKEISQRWKQRGRGGGPTDRRP